MCNLFHMSPARVKEGETRLNKTLAYFAALCYIISCAGVVKLADALDSKSCGVKSVSVRVRPPAPTSKSAPLREECGRFSYARRACTSVHRKNVHTAPQAQSAFASACRGQCRKAFPPDTHASASAVCGLLRLMATLDKKESAFFSHYDPNIVEWFVKMVEERKKHHDSSKEKKAW